MKFACMCSCTCLSNTPTFFSMESSPTCHFWNDFLNLSKVSNFDFSSSRNGWNCEFSSTLHSNCMTSSSILLNLSFHCLLNLDLSYLSPSNSKHAKHQATLNQNSCKQIKSIKLPSNQISPNEIKPNQILSNQIKSNYSKQFNWMNQRSWKNHIRDKQLIQSN